MAHPESGQSKQHKHQQHPHPNSKQKHAGRGAAAAAAHKHLHDPAVKHVVSQLGAAKDTQHQTLGLLLFGGMAFAAGAAPWTLPWLFVLFAVTCLPWRAYSFCQQKWVGTTGWLQPTTQLASSQHHTS